MDYIGVTERGDAGLDFSWVNKLNQVSFAIIISKSLNDKLINELIKHKNKITFHHTVTGYGGTILEPYVNNKEYALEQTQKLIANGFPEKQIVLRVDPIIPTNKGVNVAINTMYMFLYNTNISRVRYSYLDMYRHVKDRFLNKNIALPYNTFTAPKEMINYSENALKQFKELFFKKFTLESCAEKTCNQLGCISQKDRDILDLDIELKPGGFQRKGCLCCGNKLELLNNRKRCPNQCLYCYWKNN